MPDKKWEHGLVDASVLTTEKAEWLEQQFKDRLRFGLESRETLLKDCRTTLNWLLFIATVPAGYFAKRLIEAEFKQADVSLFAVASLVSVIASVTALVLIVKCMMSEEVYGEGNTPENLLTQEFCSLDLAAMKFLESANYQERIDHNKATNERISKITNGCKIITTATVLGGIILSIVAYTYFS